MPPKKAQEDSTTEPAPWYRVPIKNLVGVEHPCLVKNLEKGIDTLGGSKSVRDALDQEQSSKPVSLSLHPEDRASRPIISINNPANNVLMRITVPRRTGRKRKRGSNDAWEEDNSQPSIRKDARYLLQSLQDNSDNAEVEMIGTIDRTHVFRSMPDFSYSVDTNPIMSEVKKKIIPLQYPLVKDFQIDLSTRHNVKADLIPPPALSSHQVPSNYSYRQNPAVKRTFDPETNLNQTANLSVATKVYTYQVQFDVPSPVPSAPDPRAPPLETQQLNFVGVVTLLRHIFDTRPIWTRRALMNQIPNTAPQFLVRLAIAYVAYAMRSGPWRDTYIRFGIDPRTDPQYRVYQTLMLQLVTSKRDKKAQRDEYLRSWRPSVDKNSHIFTGKPPFPTDGKAWQLIDLVSDPVMKSLVEVNDIRDVCEYRYFGWYKNGTIAKLKILLKSKADTLMDGAEPDDSLYTKFLQLPEEYNGPIESSIIGSPTPQSSALVTDDTGQKEYDPLSGFLPKDATKRELEWAASYRAMCRAPVGARPKSGRLSKSKPEVRKSFLDPTGSEIPDDDLISRSVTPATSTASKLGDSRFVDDFEDGADIQGDMDVDEDIEDDMEGVENEPGDQLDEDHDM